MFDEVMLQLVIIVYHCKKLALATLSLTRLASVFVGYGCVFLLS